MLISRRTNEAHDERTTMSVTPATITPKALAEELGIDPKRLRGWLRTSDFARPIEAKNTTWTLDETIADAARARFAPATDEEGGEEGA
jgi:hypothetical protein